MVAGVKGELAQAGSCAYFGMSTPSDWVNRGQRIRQGAATCYGRGQIILLKNDYSCP